MIIRPIDNSIRNKYDSILKISSHAFVNALIPLMDLPEDDYRIISCEIFSPGEDVKSMDILLEGKNGLINIEFHKQPLIKKDLDRDFTSKLDISEQDRDSICLCQMILVELFVNDEFLIDELLGVITMTSSHILERENRLKKEISDAKKDALDAKEALSEISKNADKLKLTDEQKKILFATSIKL